MGLSAAEKQRRYRKRRDEDPEKRREYLLKEKQRNRKEKLAGKIKPISELSRREQKAQRSIWREYKRKERKRQKDLNNQPETPPCSPLVERQGSSRPTSEGGREKNRHKSRCYFDNNRLRKCLEKERRKVEMYRKRLRRAETSPACANKDILPGATPKTTTRRLLRRSKTTVRKTLLFHHVLIAELQKKYCTSNMKERRSMSSMVAGSILKKYKFTTHCLRTFGIRSTPRSYCRLSVTRRLRTKVAEFYERDDNSTITTGIKQTVTFRKIKKQKRLLNNTVKALHKKFLKENVTCNISYSSFWRIKPFWVKYSTEAERNTCLCKMHENFTFLVETLHKLNVLEHSELENVINISACKTNSKACMYGECEQCNDLVLNLKGIDQNQEVTWKQWKIASEIRDIKNVGKKQVTFARLQEESGRLADILQNFHELLPKFKKHFFNVRHQFEHYQTIRKTLSQTECVVHIDFAENYVGKMHAEIQSMHFGAAKKQITLHTGIVYTSNAHKTFCTVSDSMDHSPAAIWSHLHPILQDIREKNPKIETVHLFSDGPTSQYRQKNNFFLFATALFDEGFKAGTWNFFEAGHGKGAPDGVGGALKRRADVLVRCGHDIMDADSFIQKLQEAGTEVHLQVIGNKDIAVETAKLGKLNPVPGTMKIHQIITSAQGTIHYRDISCTCSVENPCKNHQAKEFTFSTFKRKKEITEKASALSTKSRKLNNESKTRPEVNEEMQNSSTEELTDEERRSAYFTNVLKELSSCETFLELKEKCTSIQDTLPFDVKGRERYILDDAYEVDLDALQICPRDVSPDAPLFPITVKADGDCLPHAGSILAFGHENAQDEIRVRTLMELVLHDDLYLSHEYLIRGLVNKNTNFRIPKNLPGNFVQYSGQYIPGIPITDATVKNIYQHEVMSIRSPRTYMGIWQMFALSSVLQSKIVSVYPKLGNESVQNDLGRLILPRCSSTNTTMYIMWTSTRTSDMNTVHWVPNHFVPLMKMEQQQSCMPSAQAFMATTAFYHQAPAQPPVSSHQAHVSSTASSQAPVPATASSHQAYESHTASYQASVSATASSQASVPHTSSSQAPEPATASSHQAHVSPTASSQAPVPPIASSHQAHVSPTASSRASVPHTVSSPQAPVAVTASSHQVAVSTTACSQASEPSTASSQQASVSPTASSQASVPHTASSQATMAATASSHQVAVSPTASSQAYVPATVSSHQVAVSPTACCQTAVPPTASSQAPVPSTASPEAPVPSTASPEAPVPSTASPEAPVPSTASPEAPVPSTASPEAPVPSTASPEAPVPTTASSEAHVPSTASPEAHVPSTASPEAPVPSTASSEAHVPSTASPEAHVPSTASPEAPVPSTASSEAHVLSIASSDELDMQFVSPDTHDNTKAFMNLKMAIPKPDELIDKFVLVLYEGKAYPGKVIDFDEENDICVECMQHVAKKSNCFIWPKIQDMCWYPYDKNILSVIPEPRGYPHSRNMFVDPEIWETIMDHLGTFS